MASVGGGTQRTESTGGARRAEEMGGTEGI